MNNYHNEPLPLNQRDSFLERVPVKEGQDFFREERSRLQKQWPDFDVYPETFEQHRFRSYNGETQYEFYLKRKEPYERP